MEVTVQNMEKTKTKEPASWNRVQVNQYIFMLFLGRFYVLISDINILRLINHVNGMYFSKVIVDRTSILCL